MSNIDFNDNRILLANSYFQSKNAKITRFWNRVVFVTDGLNFYIEALLKQYGDLKEFPISGKIGRLRKPKIVLSDDLNYAQVVKTRINGILKKVEKNIIFGKDIEQSEISTTLLERQNLTFRQDNNRVSRKTIGFSKVKEWLEHQMGYIARILTSVEVMEPTFGSKYILTFKYP